MERTVKLDLMTVAEWAAVPDNPRQRDTEGRASRAKQHLGKLVDEHMDVKAGELPDGTLVKIGGHTRAYMWMRGMTDRVPDKVRVTVYPVADLADAAERYLREDSQYAVQSTSDQFYGAFRESGYIPQSIFITKSRLVTALNFVMSLIRQSQPRARRSTVYTLAPVFLPQLIALDGINPARNYFTAGIAAGFVMTHLKYSDDCLPFWRAYNANHGNKLGREMDGVEALHEVLKQKRAGRDRHKVGGGRQEVAYLAERTVSCFEGYRKAVTFRVVPRGTDLDDYLNPVRRALFRRNLAAVPQRHIFT